MSGEASVAVPPVKGPTDRLGGMGRLFGGIISGPVVLSVVPPDGLCGIRAPFESTLAPPLPKEPGASAPWGGGVGVPPTFGTAPGGCGVRVGQP
jgi:hypothetical protein